jgi:hypothetical protein
MRSQDIYIINTPTREKRKEKREKKRNNIYIYDNGEVDM